MTVKVSELLAAMPEDEADTHLDTQKLLDGLAGELARQSVPTGAFQRGWALTGLQANIGLAYLAYWIRGWFQNADDKKRELANTHLHAAIKLLAKMGYLRGAVMKVGQTLANYPNVLPEQFIETLGKLHFDAPPMHFSLLREHVRNELGKDPEELFDSFETQAFAAASLGQVHRARLKTGEKVAVKIQYPGIGKTIRSDFRNLSAALLPMRLSKNWENLKEQLDEVVHMLELETNYEKEAESLRKARALFNEDDGIIVPRVFEQYSTSRVLTMEYIEGIHLREFMERNPSQELCNNFGVKLYRAGLRMDYSGLMMYADVHPGNYLFMNNGTLGLIDFGWVRYRNTEENDFYRRGCFLLKGPTEQRRQYLLEAAGLSAECVTAEHFKLLEVLTDWMIEPIMVEGPFNFSDEKHFRNGMETMAQAIKGRYTSGHPMWISLNRAVFGIKAILYQLRAHVDVKTIYEQELKAAGWKIPE